MTSGGQAIRIFAYGLDPIPAETLSQGSFLIFESPRERQSGRSQLEVSALLSLNHGNRICPP